MSSDGFQCELLEQKQFVVILLCYSDCKFHSVRQPFRKQCLMSFCGSNPFADEETEVHKEEVSSPPRSNHLVLGLLTVPVP